MARISFSMQFQGCRKRKRKNRHKSERVRLAMGGWGRVRNIASGSWIYSAAGDVHSSKSSSCSNWEQEAPERNARVSSSLRAWSVRSNVVTASHVCLRECTNSSSNWRRQVQNCSAATSASCCFVRRNSPYSRLMSRSSPFNLLMSACMAFCFTLRGKKKGGGAEERNEPRQSRCCNISQ